jgi:radical SAM protein with 4Fe4S-binding SPASM domain
MDGEISLTGGEPMIFDRLTELVEYIKSRDVFIATYILTKGTIPFSNQHIRMFKDNDIGIQISLDGTESINDQIRSKGVYKRCLSNLALLIKNEINASVHHVIMKRNMDDIPLFISEMDKVGVRRINFSSLVPIGPGSKEQSISPEESKRITEWMTEFQKSVRVSIIGQRPTWALVGSEGFCPVGYKTLTLYADGKFMPCRRLPITIGDARTDTFFKVWFTSEFLKKMREREKYVDVCGVCPKASECGGCRAIANAVYGNPFARDPSCWIAKAK